ncbi:MAG: AraC family transcriptional regulator [Oscillospiraceae bacterium]|nr:AraC family transcriptional regulator [Oscillospiraceae bacterium]
MLTKPTSFSFVSLDFQNDYLNLCHSGTDTCRPGVSIGPLVKEFYLVHYITSGKGTYAVNNRLHHLGPGDAFLIRPGKTVVYTADQQDPWRYCFFAFNGSAAEQYLSRTSFAHDDVIHINDDRINDLVSTTTDTLSLYPHNADLYAMSQLLKILLLFAEHCNSEQAEKGLPIRPDIQKVLDYIAFHYADPITVMDMARLIALDRSYFCRIFKNAVGVSPKDYLTKFRLDKARYYLTETSMPIGKIAESVGFQSFSSFSRLFTSQYQQSPNQYRRSFLKEEADEPCLGSH